MEEERRLMYVGITRAKEKAYLLYTRERNIYGSLQINSPSRFLDDIPEHLLEENEESSVLNDKKSLWNSGREFHGSESEVSTKNQELKTKNYKDGDRVEHETFGPGLIIASQGDILTIAFSKVGLKKLSASVAPLKKL
jgi:DNA helicase-2/ATP-dependent DNA helicase PcrA